MGDCHNCSGSCGQCGGCSGALTLTKEEIHMLYRFAEVPFLPVARRSDDTVPVYLEEPGDHSLILTLLEKKGLIDIDYHAPLSGFDYRAYAALPLHGSMALTARGQTVLDTLDIQGAAEEE